HEVPLLAFAERKDLAEELLGAAPAEEVLLVGSTLIRVAGRDRDADAELLGQIEEGRDVLGRMALEDRAVDVDGETLGLRGLDRVDRLLEAALETHRLVVMMLETVEMHGEEQVGRGLEQVQLLLEQERVGAQGDELLARHDAFDDLADL